MNETVTTPLRISQTSHNGYRIADLRFQTPSLMRCVSVYIMLDRDCANWNKCMVFDLNSFLGYDENEEAFHPVNMLNLVRFFQEFEKTICDKEAFSFGPLFCLVNRDPKFVTNAAFLLGSYMIIRHSFTVESVARSFYSIDKSLLVDYCTATLSCPDLRLTLAHCWGALERSHRKGWFRWPSPQAPYRWGMIDIEAFDHYDDPIHADLHELVPGEHYAFRGPRDLGGPRHCDNFRDGHFWSRDFSPEYLADILCDLGIACVVRLNRPQYDRRAFLDRGLAHVDLDFGGRPVPSADATARYFHLADTLALHGREGLGRAGTLAALHLMRSHDFPAREAVAWLRVVRPGSLLPEQLRYLALVEDSVRAAASASAAPVGRFPPGAAPAALGLRRARRDTCTEDGGGGLRPMAEAMRWHSFRRLLSGTKPDAQHMLRSSRALV